MATNTIQQNIMMSIILVVLSSSIYVMLPNTLRLDIGKTYSTFKTYEDDTWVLAGKEYSQLYDGTALMRAKSRTVETYEDMGLTYIVRTAKFKDNITLTDTYEFNRSDDNVNKFPISHQINILNAVGKIFHYQVTELEYTGETVKDIVSPQKFGHNMVVEWYPSNYYSKIYKYSGKDVGKLIIRYRPDSDNYSTSVRIFNPSTTHLKRLTNCTQEVNNETVCELYAYQIDNYGIISTKEYDCTEYYDYANFTLICDSKIDGNGDGLCRSGESCQKFFFEGDNMTVFEKNSVEEWYSTDSTYFLDRLQVEAIQ